MKLAALCSMVVFVAVAGCGKDDCQKLFDKLGGTPPEGAIAQCRKHIVDLRKDPMRACVLDAPDEAAVQKCIAHNSTDDAELAAKKAEKIAQEAAKDADEAAAKVQQLSTDLDALTAKMSAAIDAVANAQSAADRAAAQAKLAALQTEKAELDARVAEARAAAAKAERTKGVHISKECLENPLAKGCS